MRRKLRDSLKVRVVKTESVYPRSKEITGKKFTWKVKHLADKPLNQHLPRAWAIFNRVFNDCIRNSLERKK